MTATSQPTLWVLRVVVLLCGAGSLVVAALSTDQVRMHCRFEYDETTLLGAAMFGVPAVLLIAVVYTIVRRDWVSVAWRPSCTWTSPCWSSPG